MTARTRPGKITSHLHNICTNQTLLGVFEMQADYHSDKVALKTTTREWTYRVVNNVANIVAQELLKYGLSTSPTALLFRPGPKVVPALLGAAKAARTWSALDPTWPRARLSQILKDLKPSILIAETNTLPLVKSLNVVGNDVLNIDQLDNYAPLKYVSVDISPDSPFSIIYTSGSTGQPKGVIQTHRNILHYAQEHSKALAISSEDRFSQFYTPVYMTGLMSTFRALLNGATLFFYNPKGDEVLPIPQWIHDRKITLLHLSPSLFQQMTESLTEDCSLSTVRLIYMSGEPISSRIVALFKKWFSADCILVNNLGSTEASSHSRHFIDQKTNVTLNHSSVGYPSEGKEISLLDKNGERLPVGKIGEIAVCSHHLSPGYWGDPELTHQKFRSDRKDGGRRIYMSGDLGRMLPDGSLEYLGRSDHQVQIRGFRVELGEIEHLLMQHPEVKQAVVLCMENRNRNHLAAYVVFRQGEEPPKTALRVFLKEHLPIHMIPNAFISIDAIPLTPNGKINRSALPSYEFESRLIEEKYFPPRNALELKMAKIWEGLLDVPSIGIKDNFFDLGGDSLLAVRLISDIEKVFNRRLPLTTLLHKPTIEQLTSCLYRKSRSIAWSSLVPIKPSGIRNPLFLVHPLSGNVLCYRTLSKYLDPEQPLYALQALGFQKRQSPLYKIEEMAVHYISEIQKLQPQGPYRIGGACMGGMVAFEMACQLKQQGVDVALLAMIDAANPLRFIEPHGLTFGKTNRPSPTHFLKNGIEYMLKGDLINAFMDIKKWLGESLLKLREPGLERVLSANKQARKKYLGRAYSGSITFFWFTLSPNRQKSRSNPNLGWTQLAEKGIRVISLPIRHKNFLREPDVRLLAAELDKCLQQSYEKEGTGFQNV